MDYYEVKQLDLQKVTRVEVIDAKGRSYTNWNVKQVIASLQDNDRTLKLFIDEKIKKEVKK